MWLKVSESQPHDKPILLLLADREHHGRKKGAAFSLPHGIWEAECGRRAEGEGPGTKCSPQGHTDDLLGVSQASQVDKTNCHNSCVSSLSTS